jgi:hypothetical protein
MRAQQRTRVIGLTCENESPREEISRMRIEPVFLFDPDGTLVDSVYMFSP